MTGQTDRTAAYVGNTGIKAPVICAAGTNIILAGEQTIDGVLTSSDRVLVFGQTDPTQNGIYVSDSGTWDRALDFDGPFDIQQGTMVKICQGATYGLNIGEVTTADPITIGSTALTFAIRTGTLAGVTAIGGALISAATAAAARAVIAAAQSGANADITSLTALTSIGAGATFTNPAYLSQALTDAAPTTWNANSGSIATWTIGGNRSLSNPTNLKTGGSYLLQVTQDGTGGRTITWGSSYKVMGGGAIPQPNAAASAVTVYEFFSPDGVSLYTWGNQGVVGEARKSYATVAAANGTTVTFTADGIVVASGLTGQLQTLPNFNKALDISTNGAGGFDTGGATASSFISVYAIAKFDGTQNILACNVSTSSGSTYSGANMPVGYSFSGLIGVWPTDGASKLLQGTIRARKFNYTTFVAIFTAHASIATLTTQSISSAVPTNALTYDGVLATTTTGAVAGSFGLAADATGTGGDGAAQYSAAGATSAQIGGMASATISQTFKDILILAATPQTTFVQSVFAGSNFYVKGFSF